MKFVRKKFKHGKVTFYRGHEVQTKDFSPSEKKELYAKGLLVEEKPEEPKKLEPKKRGRKPATAKSE